MFGAVRKPSSAASSLRTTRPCVKALKIVPLTTCVDDEAQPPPMARTPTGSSSSGSPNVIRPTPRLPAVQYGSSPGMSWIGTSRVPPKANAMDAVGGSVHATRAVRS